MNQTIEKALQFKSNPRKISGTQQEQQWKVHIFRIRSNSG